MPNSSAVVDIVLGEEVVVCGSRGRGFEGCSTGLFFSDIDTGRLGGTVRGVARTYGLGPRAGDSDSCIPR